MQALNQLRLANQFCRSPLFGLGQPVSLPNAPGDPANTQIGPNSRFANLPVICKDLSNEICLISSGAHHFGILYGLLKELHSA